MSNFLEHRLHRVIAENLTDTECILWQDGDDLPKRDNFDVLLDASVLAAGKMTFVLRAWFTEGLATKQINLDHAWMELRDLRQIHAERPHRFQRRIDDDFLFGSERWLQREVLASMQTEIDEHPVQIALNGALPRMPLDKRLFKLAIWQLIDNALKYTPADTPVQLSANITDGVLTVDVTDFGKGIPNEEQRRIFERFYRSPAVKGQVPGSGLGLSIADGIVRAPNGDLTVSSHPGQTTFRITLPVRRREDA